MNFSNYFLFQFEIDLCPKKDSCTVLNMDLLYCFMIPVLFTQLILNFEFFHIFFFSIWNRFVPRERWLHNIEHGSVVLLYDSCVINSINFEFWISYIEFWMFNNFFQFWVDLCPEKDGCTILNMDLSCYFMIPVLFILKLKNWKNLSKTASRNISSHQLPFCHPRG